MKKKDGYWEKIYKDTDFGDKRRNIRVIKIADTIEHSFIRGATAALPSHGALKAACLFINNLSVTPQNISENFIADNIDKIRCEHILVAQDTTEMNYSWRKKKLEGLGPVGNDIDQGFFLHPGIMVDPEQEKVIGLAGIHLWSREYERDCNDYKKKSIEKKESYRWLTLPEGIRERIPEKIRMTVVADREADIFDLFHHHQNGKLGENTELLIRATRDRKIEGEKKLLFETIDKLSIKGRYELKVNATKNRTARTAKLVVRYKKITMAVPRTHSKKEHEPVSDIYVIDVKEVKPPSGEDAIHWTLLTTWKIESIENALEKVRWYSCRWFIEELFRILKSGYKVEKVQFDTGHALMNWCALRLLMAARLIQLLTCRDIEDPDSALPYFSKEEIKIMEYAEKKMIPAKSKRYRPPKKSFAWVVLILAIMGGYKAVPSALPPGQECLWRGLARLDAALIGFHAASG